MPDRFKTWIRVLRHNSVDSLSKEIEGADLKVSIIWMSIVGFLGTFLGLLVLGIYLVIDLLFIDNSGLQMNDLLDSFEQLLQFRYGGELNLSLGLVIAIILLLSALTTPIGLLFMSSILSFLAKLWGGEGEFVAQTYLLSTFGAPLYLITRTFWLVPYLGILLGIILSVFQIFLANRVLQAVHNFKATQALRVILVSLIVVGIFVVFGLGIMALWWF